MSLHRIFRANESIKHNFSFNELSAIMTKLDTIALVV